VYDVVDLVLAEQLLNKLRVQVIRHICTVAYMT
jgi:hypothetical protein